MSCNSCGSPAIIVKAYKPQRPVRVKMAKQRVIKPAKSSALKVSNSSQDINKHRA